MYLRLTDDRVVYDGVVSEVEVDGLDLADLGAQGELLDNLDLDRYRVLQKQDRKKIMYKISQLRQIKIIRHLDNIRQLALIAEIGSFQRVPEMMVGFERNQFSINPTGSNCQSGKRNISVIRASGKLIFHPKFLCCQGSGMRESNKDDKSASNVNPQSAEAECFFSSFDFKTLSQLSDVKKSIHSSL